MENKTNEVDNKKRNWKDWTFNNPFCTAWIIVAAFSTLNVMFKAMGGAYRDSDK